MIGCVVAPTTALRAQAAADTPAARHTPVVPIGVPVVFNGDTLFRLTGRFGPFTPETRAAAVVAKLQLLERSPTADTDSLFVVDREGYSEIAIGQAVVMTVLDDDARPLAQPRPQVARRFGATIRTAVLDARRRASPRALIIDAALATVATLTLVLLLFAMRQLFPRLRGRIEALRGAHLPAIRIQQFELLSAGRLATLLVKVARVARLFITLALLYIYVPLVLSLFPWSAPYSRSIVGYALRPFAAAWAAFVVYVPNLFYLAAGVIITRYVLAFLHMIFEAIGSGAIALEGFYADWAEPT